MHETDSSTALSAGLITRAGHGDETAWDILVRQHQETVFRLAYLLLDDADDADDVAQETFIRAFHALGRFDTSRPLQPWLLSITKNLANNRRRALGRYLAALRRLVQATPEPATSSEHATHQQWEAQTLHQAVQRLSRTDQEIIYLRYFLELSMAETAEALEVAPGTVKSRLNRALNRLQTVIAREFPGLQEERGK